MKSKSRQVRSATFKRQVLEEAQKAGNDNEVAERHGISNVQISQWRREINQNVRQRSFRFPPDIEEYLSSNVKRKGDVTSFVVKCIRDHLRVWSSGKGKLQISFLSDNQELIHETTASFLKISTKVEMIQVNPVPEGYSVSLVGDGEDFAAFTKIIIDVIGKGAKQVCFSNHSTHD